MRGLKVAAVVGVLLLATSACGSTGSEQPSTTTLPELVTTEPSPPPSTPADDSPCSRTEGPSCDFDYDNFDNPTVIDNEWLPMSPGMRLTFEGTTNEDALLEHTVVITITDLTKMIDGINTVVTWDQDFEEGKLVETELAFFAQDNDGNVWRMGEHPEEYENGVLVDNPTWIAGIEGAKAGITMLANPVVGGLSYSQGWSVKVEFIDRGRVQAVGQETCVEFGCYRNVLIIDEFNVEEVGAHQLKFFASGVGNVQVDWAGEDETREELELVLFEMVDEAELLEIRASALALEANAYAISPNVYGLTQPVVVGG